VDPINPPIITTPLWPVDPDDGVPIVPVPPPGWPPEEDEGNVPIVPIPPPGWPPEEDEGNVPIVPPPWESAEDVDYGEVPIVPPPDGWDSDEDYDGPGASGAPFSQNNGNTDLNEVVTKPSWWFWD